MFEPCPYPHRTRGRLSFAPSLLSQVGKSPGARAGGWDSNGSAGAGEMLWQVPAMAAAAVLGTS